MAEIKTIYKRFDGLNWNTYYFKTTADLIAETPTYKVMTSTERNSILTYLNSFNAANKLLKLDSNGLISESLIPGGLGYLSTSGGSMSGNIDMGGNTKIIGALEVETKKVSGPTNGTLTIAAGDGQIIDFYSTEDIMTFSGAELRNIKNPTSASSAATKSYVDGLVSTATKPASAPVAAASSLNLTLSGTQTVDGFDLLVGDRVLVYGQTSASQNGIYTVASAEWTKHAQDSLAGTLVFVEHGNLHNDWMFYNSTGTAWVEFSKVDTITAGAGLEKTGTHIKISSGGVNDSMISNVGSNKISNFRVYDNATARIDSWGELKTQGTLASLPDWLDSALSAIGQLRGTTNYNTNNAQTISGAYSLIDTKNKNLAGAVDVSTITGMIAGDVYLQTV